MMLKDTVPDAMAEAFEASSGHLAQRILAALDAAQAEGGDIRGSQSAAILVRRAGKRLDHQWDLRVDNDPMPLAKLRELVNIRAAARVLALAEKDASREALEAAFAEANRIAPGDEQTFWFAVTGLYQAHGDVDGALAHLRPIFARAPQWEELLLRLEAPGLEKLKAAIQTG